MGPYVYSPLLPVPNSIRLLRILPATDEKSIFCELFDYQLHDNQSCLYEALSYSWGDARIRPHRISINGGDHYVAVNLFAALCRLQDQHLQRTVWIDALCINQEDNDERASQVRFMAKIYSYASRVVVWLGEAADDSDVVYQILRAAADQRQRDFDDIVKKRTTDDYGRKKIKPEPMLKQDDLHKFLQRPWFRRVWVLQEFAAAQFVLLYCGQDQITGQVFCQGLRAMTDIYEGDAELQRVVGSMTSLMDWNPGLTTGTTSVTPSRQDSLNILPLGELVEMFHSRDATDNRDKVYALMGMSSDPTDFTVDYGVPWSELFRNLILHIFPSAKAIATWDEREVAVMRVRACALGRVKTIDSAGYFLRGKQVITVKSDHFRGPNCHRTHFEWSATWSVQSTAFSILPGDIICLVEGALQPTIIRSQNDYFSVVSITVNAPQDITSSEWPDSPVEWLDFKQLIQNFDHEILLAWNWAAEEAFPQDIELTVTKDTAESEQIFGDYTWNDFDTAPSRISYMIQFMEDLGDDREIERLLDHAQPKQIGESLGERSYLRLMDEIIVHWDAYMRIKVAFECLQWSVWVTMYESQWGHSFEWLRSYYQAEGNIRMGLLDVIGLCSSEGNTMMDLDGLHRANTLDFSPPPFESFERVGVDHTRDIEQYPSLNIVLTILFPQYASLPEWPVVDTGFYWQNRFLRRLILNSRGEQLYYTDKIILSSMESMKYGIFTLSLLVDHIGKPMPIDSASHDVATLPDRMQPTYIDNISYRLKISWYLLWHRDPLRREYIALKTVVDNEMAYHNSIWPGRSSRDDMVVNTEDLLYLVVRTPFCEICVSRGGGLLLEDLFALHHDAENRAVFKHYSDYIQDVKLKFRREVENEGVPYAEAARARLEACLKIHLSQNETHSSPLAVGTTYKGYGVDLGFAQLLSVKHREPPKQKVIGEKFVYGSVVPPGMEHYVRDD